MSGANVEYDAERDTVAGVRELLDDLRAAERDVLIDWRYAHTLSLEIDRLTP